MSADPFEKYRRTPRDFHLPPSHFEEVAEVYRLAFSRGEAPTNKVAEVLGLARSTAGRHVQRARSMGLLPPTRQGAKSA